MKMNKVARVFPWHCSMFALLSFECLAMEHFSLFLRFLFALHKHVSVLCFQNIFMRKIVFLFVHLHKYHLYSPWSFFHKKASIHHSTTSLLCVTFLGKLRLSTHVFHRLTYITHPKRMFVFRLSGSFTFHRSSTRKVTRLCGIRIFRENWSPPTRHCRVCGTVRYGLPVRGVQQD